MRIDPVVGAKIERSVRAVYARALEERDLDEGDRELIDAAVNQRVIILVADALMTHRARLDENTIKLLSRAEHVLEFAHSLLGIADPYRCRKPN